MQWFYANSGQQLGPVSLEELHSLARSGIIRPDTLIWRDGMPRWLPASQIPDLTLPFTPISSVPAQGVSQGSSPYAAPPSSFNPGPQGLYQGEYISNTGPLVFSIIMTVITFLLCCFPVGAIGVIFAALIPSKLAAGDVAGAKNFSKISYICSIVTLAVIILYFAVMIFAVVLGGVR